MSLATCCQELSALCRAKLDCKGVHVIEDIECWLIVTETQIWWHVFRLLYDCWSSPNNTTDCCPNRFIMVLLYGWASSRLLHSGRSAVESRLFGLYNIHRLLVSDQSHSELLYSPSYPGNDLLPDILGVFTIHDFRLLSDRVSTGYVTGLRE